MKNAIVSNTGPLVALAVIDKLEILSHLFDQILVPNAVHLELLEGGKNHSGVSTYEKNQLIKVRKLIEPLNPLLDSVLDTGEASVIQLAKENNIDLVLIDERKGRKIAREVYNLRVIGSARILVEAKHKGYLESVEKEIVAMRQHGYWLHDKIVDIILKEAGER